MPVAEPAHPVSLFRSQIRQRRFDDETLRILESLLVSKDVISLVESRSCLNELIRSELPSIIHEIAEKTIEHKLLVLEFLVRASALVGDIENCLALKYEALLLREVKSTSHQWLRVSYMEWLNFAENSLNNGFYSIARHASENALLCFEKSDLTESSTGEFVEIMQIIEKIKRVKDHAVSLTASGSVQAQAAEYLKKKIVEKSTIDPSFCREIKYDASTLFRNGIKKRHLRKLHERRCTKQKKEF